MNNKVESLLVSLSDKLDLTINNLNKHNVKKIKKNNFLKFFFFFLKKKSSQSVSEKNKLSFTP